MDSELLAALAMICFAYGLITADDWHGGVMAWLPWMLAGTLGVAAFMTG